MYFFAKDLLGWVGGIANPNSLLILFTLFSWLISLPFQGLMHSEGGGGEEVEKLDFLSSLWARWFWFATYNGFHGGLIIFKVPLCYRAREKSNNRAFLFWKKKHSRKESKHPAVPKFETDQRSWIKRLDIKIPLVFNKSLILLSWFFKKKERMKEIWNSITFK